MLYSFSHHALVRPCDLPSMQQSIGEKPPELVTLVSMECEDIVTGTQPENVIFVNTC